MLFACCRIKERLVSSSRFRASVSPPLASAQSSSLLMRCPGKIFKQIYGKSPEQIVLQAETYAELHNGLGQISARERTYLLYPPLAHDFWNAVEKV